MASKASFVSNDDRATGRDEVHFRAKAFGPDAQPVPIIIVNMSAMGLMARCEADLQPGDSFTIQLPIIGTIGAQIRWSLGGRIGCELDQTINLADYYELLAVMLKAR